jgi:hypothetical protein
MELLCFVSVLKLSESTLLFGAPRFPNERCVLNVSRVLSQAVHIRFITDKTALGQILLSASLANLLWARSQIVYKFKIILSRAHGNFEMQSKVLEPSIIITNYCIIISNTYFNYTINAQYKGLIEECVRKKCGSNWAAATS